MSIALPLNQDMRRKLAEVANTTNPVACRQEQIVFIPLPAQTFGALHAGAVIELRRIDRVLARETGKDEKTARHHLF